MEVKMPRYPKEKYDDMAMPNDDVCDAYFSGLQSHLVKTRKNAYCIYCGAPIYKGDFSLSEKGFMDGSPYLVHYCMDCVDDVIDGWEGKIDYQETGYKNWEERYKKYMEPAIRNIRKGIIAATRLTENLLFCPTKKE